MDESQGAYKRNNQYWCTSLREINRPTGHKSTPSTNRLNDTIGSSGGCYTFCVTNLNWARVSKFVTGKSERS